MMQSTPSYTVLGIESSCDEMAAAVIRNGSLLLASVVRGQHDVHRPYGGVVPELASRDHVRAVSNVVEAALREAEVDLDEITGIAVTAGARPRWLPAGGSLIRQGPGVSLERSGGGGPSSPRASHRRRTLHTGTPGPLHRARGQRGAYRPLQG